jgi:hypothetical protein
MKRGDRQPGNVDGEEGGRERLGDAEGKIIVDCTATKEREISFYQLPMNAKHSK